MEQQSEFVCVCAVSRGVQGDSIEQIAREMGMSQEALERSVAHWIAVAEQLPLYAVTMGDRVCLQFGLEGFGVPLRSLPK